MLEKPGRLPWSDDHQRGTVGKNRPIRASVTPVREDTASPESNPEGASDGPTWRDSRQRDVKTRLCHRTDPERFQMTGDRRVCGRDPGLPVPARTSLGQSVKLHRGRRKTEVARKPFLCEPGLGTLPLRWPELGQVTREIGNTGPCRRGEWAQGDRSLPPRPFSGSEDF